MKSLRVTMQQCFRRQNAAMMVGWENSWFNERKWGFNILIMDKHWCLTNKKTGFHQKHFDVSISYWPTEGSPMFAGYILHHNRSNGLFTQKSCQMKDISSVVSQCAMVRIQKPSRNPPGVVQVSLEIASLWLFGQDIYRYCL